MLSLMIHAGYERRDHCRKKCTQPADPKKAWYCLSKCIFKNVTNLTIIQLT